MFSKHKRVCVLVYAMFYMIPIKELSLQIDINLIALSKSRQTKQTYLFETKHSHFVFIYFLCRIISYYVYIFVAFVSTHKSMFHSYFIFICRKKSIRKNIIKNITENMAEPS